MIGMAIQQFSQSNKSAGFALRDLRRLLDACSRCHPTSKGSSRSRTRRKDLPHCSPTQQNPNTIKSIFALRRKDMKIPILIVTVLAGLLPVAVGQLPLRYFNCEAGAACRDGTSHGNADYSEDTLGDCAERCDGNNDCNG